MIKIFLYLSIFLTYTLSMYVYAHIILDPRISAALWVSSLLLSLLLLYSYKKRAPISSEIKRLSIYKLLKENYILIAIIILAILLRFWALDSIPILTHDEGKDTGLFPEMVLNGELKDYFGFYQGMNNFFFVFSSIPHLLTDNLVLKARLFSGLFGVLSVLLIYIVGKKMYSRKVGLIAAFFLSVYHVHIHFSRTEFLNLFDSFYTLIILLVFILLSRSWKIKHAILLAITLGFGLHFYSGLRSIILLSSLTFLIFTIFKCNIKKALVYLAVFSIFFMIALGPLSIVMATRSEETKAMGVATFVFSENQSLNDNLSKLTINYKDSLLAYVKNPIDFHYNYGGPFLVFPFSIFFLIGIFLIVKRVTNPINFLILSSMLLIPFFNSAILTSINNTHRLLSLVPLIALVTSLGVEKIALIIEKVINKKATLLFVTLFCSYFAIYNIHLYFYKSAWEKTLNVNEFRAWEAQKLINQENNKNTLVLFVGSSYNSSYKGVPSLEYLSKKYTVIDILNPEMLYQIINYRNFNYLFIILPDNNIISKEQILTKYFYLNKAYFKKVYYKSMYLFDILKITKPSEY